MRTLTLLHRWFGVVFCLFFTMWFASGLVMHFVPFPALTAAERWAGLLSIDRGQIKEGPRQAIAASGINEVRRVRLLARVDGPVYVVSGSARIKALRAADLGEAAIHTAQSALRLAVAQAQQHGMDSGHAEFAQSAPYDQWTMSASLDVHRPLYRIALNDEPGTELYVSTTTGEVVLDTTRRERWWNYVGSVVHWIYPTPLRSRPALWSAVVWWLLLCASSSAKLGHGIPCLSCSQFLGSTTRDRFFIPT
jgi:uncharacterized iron-regulated membrane protein